MMIRYFALFFFMHCLTAIGTPIFAQTQLQEDTFTPYREGEVPDNVVDLWKDVDSRSGLYPVLEHLPG